MKRVMIVMAAVTLIIGLASCDWFFPPQEEGNGRISVTIEGVRSAPMSIGSKDVPAETESVRVRSWHSSGVNVASQGVVQSDSVTIGLSVPAKSNYSLAVVTAKSVAGGWPVILTGGKEDGINVLPNVTTNVPLLLTAYTSDPRNIPVSVEAHDVFTFTVDLAHAELVEDIIGDSAILFGSWDAPTDDWNPSVIGSAIISGNKATVVGTAPSTATTRVLYMVVFANTNGEWAVPGQSALRLAMPNVFYGENPMTMLIKPSTGTLEVIIE